MRMPQPNRYAKIIERVFLSRYKSGAEEILFEREDIVRVAKKLGIKLPKNLGDVIYSFRYRTPLPESVRAKAPAGKEWIIRPAGTARYRFVATDAALAKIAPCVRTSSPRWSVAPLQHSSLRVI